MISLSKRINEVNRSVHDEYSDTFSQPSEVDEIVGLLYAPNPSTGLPDPSLGLVLSGKGDPDLTKYVKDRLFVANGSVVGSSENADDALASIIPFDMQLGSERAELARSYLGEINEYSKTFIKDDR